MGGLSYPRYGELLSGKKGYGGREIVAEEWEDKILGLKGREKISFRRDIPITRSPMW